MTRGSIPDAIDDLLSDYGFNRRKSTWVRSRSLFWDVVEVQPGRSIEGVTVNVAVMHWPTYELAWGEPTTTPLSEAECIVRCRLQSLLNGRDRWWIEDDPTALKEITHALSSTALPFFESFAELGDMERWLEASKAIRYPPQALYLAAVKHQCGEDAQAQHIVEQLLTRTTSGPWKKRIQGLASALN